MSNWNTMTVTQLEMFVKSLKANMMTVINMDAETRSTAKDEKSCPPEASFQLNFLLLQKAEREIMNRGMNPADVRFGHDLMSEVAEVQVEVMQGLR